MSTIRVRDGKFQALVRIKRAGTVIYSEARTFDQRKLAVSWADQLERKLKADGIEARVRSNITFSELIGRYIRKRSEVKLLGRAIRGDLDMLDRTLGHLPLSTLTASVWSNFVSTRRQQAGPATVLHNLSIARTVLNSARPVFGIDVDGSAVSQCILAMTMSGHVARSVSRERRPTQDELSALKAEFERIAAHPQTQLPMAYIVDLAVHLPRRLGELCDMRWLDYDGRTVTLRDTKHPRVPRTELVPVPAGARKIIDALPRFDERILPYKSESVSASFERACKRLDIDDLRFHDLRHEGICRLFELGLGIPEVAMISGHQSWSNLKRYTHLRPEAVLEKLDG